MERSKKILLESMGAVGAGGVISAVGYPEIGAYLIPIGGFNTFRLIMPQKGKKKLKKVV
jgi:hypothetical protein